MFYIKKLIVTGKNVETSEVDFTSGLNIVYGPSNTGKSYIVECLDYMFGSEEIRFKSATGYDRVRLIIDVDGKEISISRAFDSNEFNVTSDVPNVKGGVYKTKSGVPSISDLWLNLMGIHEPTQIISNQQHKPRKLTLRTFFHSFFIPESSVIKEDSILLPFQNTAMTAAKTALLYLINGNNYLNENDEYEDAKVKTAKKDAVVKYINNQIDDLGKRQQSVTATEGFSAYDLQQKIDEILSEIESAEGEVSLAVKRSRELAEELISVGSDIAEIDMIQNRYEVLLSQYQSDVKRLTFLVEGELHEEGIEQPTRCPFCNGELPKQERESCVEAATKELQKIIPQINDLQDAIDDAQFEFGELESKRDELERERTAIETEIKTVLQPRVDSLRTNLVEYSKALRNQTEHQFISTYVESIKMDLFERMGEVIDETPFNVVSEYGDTFVKDMSAIITRILQDVKFDDIVAGAIFDPKTFDIKIGNQPKKTYGKGYAAFLNTVLAIAMQEYISEKGLYSPGMLIVDSPILSLQEKLEGDTPVKDGMKESLFKYLISHQSDRQTIIIENRIPPLEYKKNSVNMIQFTKMTHEGRYGFLKTSPR